MHNIRRRGDKYQVQIRRKGRPAAVKTFTKYADAKTWLHETETSIHSSTETRGLSSETPFSKLVALYVERHLPKLKSSKQELSLANKMTTALGSCAAASITNHILADYRDRRLGSVSPQTVKHEINFVRRVLRLAIDEWGLSLLRVPQVRLPKLPHGRDRRLTENQLEKVLSSLSVEARDICVFAIETGMRRSELLNLQWADVNYDERTLCIRNTKNGLDRVIPLTRKAMALLKSKSDDEVPFRLQPDSITQAFNRACTRAGVENFRFHDLRHEAISRLFEKGLSVPQVAAISGHQDYRMLARYVHLHRFELE